jgi:CDP-glucose 4,6-dehydratase
VEKVAGLMPFANTYKGKKVFLTGHTGFKGSWLAQWLLNLGAEVTGYSKDIPTKPALYETLGLAKHLHDFRNDIRDQETLEKALRAAKPDIVFHLAAQPLVRLSYENPLETFEENTFGTARVLEAIRRIGGIPATVVITTDKVYENSDAGRDFRESDPLGGHDPYSASKAAAEIVFSSYARSFFQKGTRMCSARAGNVIGGGDWALDRLVPDCVKAWERGQKVAIRNPSYTRPWEHVLEPLGGYLLLGQRLLENPQGVHGEAFNFGPSEHEEFTTLQLVQAMEKRWAGAGHEIQGAQDPTKKEAAALRLNCDKAKKVLSWKPSLSFEDTAAWTIDWYIRHSQKDPGLKEFTHRQISEFAAKQAF